MSSPSAVTTDEVSAARRSETGSTHTETCLQPCPQHRIRLVKSRWLRSLKQTLSCLPRPRSLEQIPTHQPRRWRPRSFSHQQPFRQHVHPGVVLQRRFQVLGHVNLMIPGWVRCGDRTPGSRAQDLVLLHRTTRSNAGPRCLVSLGISPRRSLPVRSRLDRWGMVLWTSMTNRMVCSLAVARQPSSRGIISRPGVPPLTGHRRSHPGSHSSEWGSAALR